MDTSVISKGTPYVATAQAKKCIFALFAILSTRAARSHPITFTITPPQPTNHLANNPSTLTIVPWQSKDDGMAEKQDSLKT
jgi:hypothetical protein